jgi:hypothetical protein
VREAVAILRGWIAIDVRDEVRIEIRIVPNRLRRLHAVGCAGAREQRRAAVAAAVSADFAVVLSAFAFSPDEQPAKAKTTAMSRAVASRGSA